MSKHDNQHDDKAESRRHFLKLAAGTAAVAVVGTGVFPHSANAATLTPLSESDPLAKALHYTDDASTTTDPKHKKGDDCANCMFYQGKAGAPDGPCQIFPGHTVNAHGWCESHHTKT